LVRKSSANSMNKGRASALPTKKRNENIRKAFRYNLRNTYGSINSDSNT
jgi:hypothetical protein